MQTVTEDITGYHFVIAYTVSITPRIFVLIQSVTVHTFDPALKRIDIVNSLHFLISQNSSCQRPMLIIRIARFLIPQRIDLRFVLHTCNGRIFIHQRCFFRGINIRNTVISIVIVSMMPLICFSGLIIYPMYISGD
ncbi:hypothetical protein D3C80_1353570 [compost metagenome]